MLILSLRPYNVIEILSSPLVTLLPQRIDVLEAQLPPVYKSLDIHVLQSEAKSI